MRSVPLLALPLIALPLLALAGPAQARSTLGQVSAPAQGAAARLLDAAARAQSHTAYTGTQYLTSWSPMGSVSSVVRISHAPQAGTVATVVPTINRTGGQVVTDDDETLQLGPVDSRALSLLLAHYELVVVGPANCVGRPATLVEARRGGAGTAAARFWVDDATDLVLRREVYADDGSLLRASVFAALDLSPTSLPSAPAQPSTVGRLLTSDARLQVAADGYAVPSTLPGGLDLFDARRAVDDERAVVHATYSDGLSTLSLFSQQGRLGTPGADWSRQSWGGATVWLRTQPPLQVTWQDRGMVYTIVSDGEPQQVRAAVASLPHRGAEPGGWWSRFDRGVHRLGSWLNPFD